MPVLSVNNVLIHYLAAGDDGSPVVLLHGGGLDSAPLSWSDTIPALSAVHRVYAPDYPGYGKSGDDEVVYTIDYYVEMLKRFMDTVGIARASLAGVSLGGGIALGFALRHPERMDRLVLVNSYGLASKAPAQFWSWLFIRIPGVNALTWAIMRRSKPMVRWTLGSIFHDSSNIPEGLVETVHAEAQNPRAGKAFESFQKHEITRKGLRTAFRERLREIEAPTLIVHGAHDRLVPLAAAQEAARRLSRATLHVIPDCGHWPQREKPEEFNRVVGQFLA